MTQKFINALSYKIIGCAIEVHRHLGPGLLESVYSKCFIKELTIQDLSFKNELLVPVMYKQYNLETEYRLDVLVEDLIIVELKSIERLLPVHGAQLLTYMKLMQKPKGVLINFNCTNIFKEGQKTFVNKIFESLPLG